MNKRRLKRGHRVSAIYMNGDGEVRKGRVGGQMEESAYAVDDGAWLNFLNRDDEGVVWARGWDTTAARALRSAVALLDPKDRR